MSEKPVDADAQVREILTRELSSGLADDVSNDLKPNETPGMDASVVRLANAQLLLSTTDFFYPLVEDPYLQGKIACANVLSDLYAMGVTEVDTMLMILGVCRLMSQQERDIVTTQLIKGFNDLARQANTNCTGGQTVVNPWPIVGGVAMSVREESGIIRPENAKVGDVIILTKPLGTQVAVNCFQWRRQPKAWKTIESIISRVEVDLAYDLATESMCRLNKTAAELMHKYEAHSCTDVTGFGILGHLENMVNSQIADVDFELHSLPIIKKMTEVNMQCKNIFKLLDGFSAETSGGLMFCLPSENAEPFINDILELDGQPAWVIGRVVDGSKKARILDDVNVIEV